MSSRWLNKRRYETGEKSLTYFRRHKHHRTGKNVSFNPIRWRMFIAKGWQKGVQWDKQALEIADKIK